MSRFLAFLVSLAMVAVLVGCSSETPTPLPTSPPSPTTAAATATMASATPTTAPTTAAVTPTSVPPTATPNPFASVPGIVDPKNMSYPRQVVSGTTTVTIKAKPQRIHTVSLGLDEVTYALVPAARVVAVARFTQDPGQSNVADLSKNAAVVARDPEQIIAQNPDIVLASPSSSATLVTALRNAGVTVVAVGLNNTAQNRIENILLMGYIFGEEQRAIKLAAEVQGRVTTLSAFTGTKAETNKPRVLSLTSFTDKVYTAGTGSTEGAIIDAAGGLNVAVEAGLSGNPTTSFEGIIAMRPEVIFIPQPIVGAETFRQTLLKSEALKDVPAIKNGKVYTAEPKWFTTLSFWNVRGSEELAKLIWPADMGTKTFPPFSLP